MENTITVPADRPWFNSWPKYLPQSLVYPDVPLFENLKTSAQRYPDKAAMIYYGARMSYGQLWENALSFAGYLKQMGIKKGDRVAIYTPNTPHFAIAFYGILRANGVVVTLDPMLSADELVYVINDSGSRILITMGYTLPLINKVKGQTCLEKIIAGDFTDYLPETPELPVNDFLLAQGQYDDATEKWNKVIGRTYEPPEVEVDSDSNALLIYSSGTTGKRKAALHTHKGQVIVTVRVSEWLRCYSSSIHLAILPFFHVSGLNCIMTPSIYTGGTMVTLTRWNRESAIQAVEKYRCTHWLNATAMVVDMLSTPGIENRDLSSFVMVGGGGGVVPNAVGERLKQMGIDYMEGFGMSETGASTHVNPPERVKLQCLGVPLPDVDTLIIDPKSGEAQPPGVQGELIIRTPSMFKGYWGKPKETEETFIEIDGQKWLKTGDLGFMDEDGYFFVVDRIKRMVNRAGLKVWPAAVEATMYKHPGIKEVCIIGTPDERVGEEVTAVVVLHDEQKGKITEKEILDWSKANLAAYEYPRIVKFAEALPKNSTGKILWRELQSKAREGGL